MLFARRVFIGAAIWGVICLPPTLFLEASTARLNGPMTYPEYYYAFILTALVFQGVFFAIGRDPARYRPLMLLGVGEKLSLVIPVAVLLATHRLGNSQIALFALIDLSLGVLFAISWFKTRPTV